MRYWQRVKKADPRASVIADRHYNRRKVGSPQFMPPGQTIVLLGPGTTLFGWWRPDPATGIKAMNGLDGWTCTIFRREQASVLASELILDAEQAVGEFGYDIGPDGFLTYVWDSKVASANPGYCFKKAGWTIRGRSADGRKTLLGKCPPVMRCGECGRWAHHSLCPDCWAAEQEELSLFGIEKCLT